MAIDRYSKDPVIDLGSQYGTSNAILLVRRAIQSNKVLSKTVVLQGFQRLDTLAGVHYGDSRYWWILAAASNIGWGMQVPAGTVIKVPNLHDILALFS